MKLILPAALTWIAFAGYLLPGAVDQELASAGPPVVRHASAVELVDGHDVHWWARRSRANGAKLRQSEKNSEARGRTIRRLQSAQLTASAHFFTWLGNADCIYRHERGADGWATNTGNGYYGGVQADRSFQTTYGPDLIRRYGGWAHTWPWYAQLQMAYRGWLFRGWNPWPNTSRACGLR